MYEGIVQDLIDELGRLPGVGPKSAQRIAFHLLAADPTDVRRLAHVLTGDADRAADLVQDALERTLMAWPRIERKDDPEGYVRRAIVNRHVSVWRRLRRERLVEDAPDRYAEELVRFLRRARPGTAR